MFLKRLDVIGFKSFAQRVTVDFVKGVTAVVDQTEAAKVILLMRSAGYLESNQQKPPRRKNGRHHFAGSDSRKRVNLAEVTLTLDNEDHFCRSIFTKSV